ncbi:PITH domain-containing protein [Blastocladiella britannica]|nr:PITH domain-containing protein [Blastocladiella britannica]
MSCADESHHDDHAEHHHPHGGAGHDHDHDSPERGAEFSLWQYINLDHIRALNETRPGSARDVFRPWDERLIEDRFIESDADEQLLIHIPFTGQVKLKTIALRVPLDESAPSELKAYINCDLDFDAAESTVPTQKWDLLAPADIVAADADTGSRDGIIEYQTRITKFNAVRSLTLFFPANYGADTSILQYIGLAGDFTPINKDPIITLYEAAANPADHAPVVGLNALQSKNLGL